MIDNGQQDRVESDLSKLKKKWLGYKRDAEELDPFRRSTVKGSAEEYKELQNLDPYFNIRGSKTIMDEDGQKLNLISELEEQWEDPRTPESPPEEVRDQKVFDFDDQDKEDFDQA